MAGRWWRGRGRNRTPDRAPVRCVAHEMDLGALRRFTTDGAPSADDGAPSAVRDRECPACRPRYIAGGGVDVHVSRDGQGHATCSCCGTAWQVEESTWVAVVGSSLRMIGYSSRPPTGATIDGRRFVVETLDPPTTLKAVTRAELAARVAAAGGLPNLPKGPDPGADPADQPEPTAARGVADDLTEDDEDFVDFVVDGVMRAVRGRADLESQIALAVQERGLTEEGQIAWYDEIVAVLRDIQRAMRGLVRLDVPRPTRHRGVSLSEERVDEIVQSAIDSLPPDLAAQFENVAVSVVTENGRRDAYGLYQGVPATARSRDRSGFPDRITIFLDTIYDHAASEEEAEEQIRRTVLHEIGHYFGIDDPRLRELGW